METLLIKNGFIVTMNEQRECFFGDILISEDRISAIAPALSEEKAEEIIDATGKIVIPGLIQTHVHLCQTLFRGLANDLALMEWLNIIMPLESCHDTDSSYISAKLGIAEMLKSGTTTINDMGTVFFAAETAEAVKEMGIRAQLGRTIMDSDWSPAYLRHDTEKGIQEAEDFIRKWHYSQDANITCGIPIRWVLTTTDQAFKAAKELALKYDIPIHTHANENHAENQAAVEQKGMPAIEYFHEIGLTEGKMQVAHCIHLTQKERQILKENNISVLHCPSCNLKAASGIAPIPEYFREGINVSLGADTAACNDNLDPFTEMRMATIIQKPRLGPTSICAEDAFYMATRGGAEALSLEHSVGSLEVGKKADVVILDRSLRNTPFHYQKAVSSLVYSFNGRDVNTTIVNGKILVKDGRITAFDEAELVKEADNAVNRVVARAIEKGLYIS